MEIDVTLSWVSKLVGKICVLGIKLIEGRNLTR